MRLVAGRLLLIAVIQDAFEGVAVVGAVAGDAFPRLVFTLLAALAAGTLVAFWTLRPVLAGLLFPALLA